MPQIDPQNLKDQERYREAARRKSTVRSYQSALHHYQRDFGGRLPATSDDVAAYLAAYAGTLRSATLSQRLAALRAWHRKFKFPDPTESDRVRDILKGIRNEHAYVPQRARPIMISDLRRAADGLMDRALQAAEAKDEGGVFRAQRDRALLLLGFWKGFRSDELQKLQIQHIDFRPEGSMRIELPVTKGDREAAGRSYTVPAIQRLCPVDACKTWLYSAQLMEAMGPVFRPISRWGKVEPRGLNVSSFNRLIRSALSNAGVAEAETYSSHSLRRGLAYFAHEMGWSAVSLQRYVGWKSVTTAAGYIDEDTREAGVRINGYMARLMEPQ